MKKYLLSVLGLLLPILSFAQEKGLDEKVNDAFMPIATAWEGLVLTTVCAERDWWSNLVFSCASSMMQLSATGELA